MTSSHFRSPTLLLLLLLLLLTATSGSASMTSHGRRHVIVADPTSRVVNMDDPCKAGQCNARRLNVTTERILRATAPSA